MPSFHTVLRYSDLGTGILSAGGIDEERGGALPRCDVVGTSVVAADLGFGSKRATAPKMDVDIVYSLLWLSQDGVRKQQQQDTGRLGALLFICRPSFSSALMLSSLQVPGSI